ncbi:DNA repair helicase XPB [Candidatus Parabeggiatoa sp. HSG14]|uniref:DNA repair helicase XPB n=1 Tax=Candidatus Parabeggiatoa sp. HSG14 TaxID=3055593 RepID=UPI0025A7BB97|nr:DEAD/DEAH box helicase [Thiotrichales bacterium HSG14]
MSSPLIVQSDHTLLLEVEHDQYVECRDFLVLFAELVKSPEFIHTYKITPLSLWNAAALEISLQEIFDGLQNFSKYPLPANVLADIQEWYASYGKLVLQKESKNRLLLQVEDTTILERLIHDKSLKSFWLEESSNGLFVAASERGNVKYALIKAGYPVKDLCGYLSGEDLVVSLRDTDLEGNPFALRDYQQDAVDAFYHAGRKTGGNGIIVLPCGSGKTIIGLGAIASISNHTLIVTTNNVSVHQWQHELLSKTYLSPDDIGEYTGMLKKIRPITITTYQMLTHRKSKEDSMNNLDLFTNYNWGLIVYDEVHLLPAPIFRATTDIQAKRRLGLTATLVREDGKEDDVFALIGPKRYDVPWKTLESRGYIAEAFCTEYRLQLPPDEELAYAHAQKRERFRIASENSKKIELVEELLADHADDYILVIGQYITQLNALANHLKYPLITGKTKHTEREKLYGDFKTGKIKVLIVSKVANFAVDLPDANVLIQISGSFGSRQEEAQRLGRILRPKKQSSFFYTLVSKGTDEQRFSVNRQLFLVEQGYRYHIEYFE